MIDVPLEPSCTLEFFIRLETPLVGTYKVLVTPFPSNINNPIKANQSPPFHSPPHTELLIIVQTPDTSRLTVDVCCRYE